MRPLVLGTFLLVLSGCVLYERRPYAPQSAPAASGPARRVLSEQQAVEQAFRLAQERELRVDRVERASLDAAGRWHITLAGYLDRAQMLLDGGEGKLLKGRFRRGDTPVAPNVPPDGAPPQGAPLDDPEEWD